MTRLFTAAALVIALSTGAIATSASAAPTYGLTIGDGYVNPFAAEDK
ncbi:MAG: hypothetical protein ACR2O4_02290 [Hyphomicrobiaceae bacterium]